MTIQELGSLGELVGAIGVILSLVYLATQIRQNTRTVRSSSIQASNLTIGNTIALMGQTPQNADVLYRGMRSYDELSGPEQTHFLLMVAGVFVNCDAMYMNYREGVLPPEVWEREQRTLRVFLSAPGGHRVWAAVQHTIVTQPFADFVSTHLQVANPPAA